MGSRRLSQQDVEFAFEVECAQFLVATHDTLVDEDFRDGASPAGPLDHRRAQSGIVGYVNLFKFDPLAAEQGFCAHAERTVTGGVDLYFGHGWTTPSIFS